MTDDAAQRQLRQACAALDRALRTGSTARAETWLESCPALAADSELAVELIYSEFIAREALGTVPPATEYYTRFPTFADKLRRMFEVDELLKSDDGAASSIITSDVTKFGAPPVSAAPAPRRVGQYELLERLGGGGMGVVYRARQTRPARDVALKLLRSGADAGALELARFRREAEAAARLHHPNIVTLYEIGEAGAQPFIALEYMAGGDLRQALAGRPQPAPDAAKMVALLARAVHFAHDQGVVHRDLKPANILVGLTSSTADGVMPSAPKIADFGLAAITDSRDGLTRTGQILGTAAYLAPEQAAGKAGAAEPTVDIYALGAILYECLTGRPPFVADSEADAVHQVLHEEPISVRRLRPSLPRDLNTIVNKCLAKAPTRRYATALALAEDLDRFVAGEAIFARPVGVVEALWKWTKRRPATASLIGVCTMAVIIISALTVIYTTNLRASLKEEDFQRNRAEENERQSKIALAAESKRRAQARSALDQLTDRLLADGVRSTRKSSEQMAALEQALKAYEELASDSADDEPSRIGAARAHWNASRLLQALGRWPEATRAADKSITAWAALCRDFPQTLDYRFGYAGALHDRGRLRSMLDKDAESVEDYLESLAQQRQLRDAATVFGKAREARTSSSIVLPLRALGRDGEADKYEQQSLAAWEQLIVADPAVESYRLGLAAGLQNRGMRAESQKRLDDATADYQRAIELRSPAGQLPSTSEARIELAHCHGHLGRLAADRNDIAEAVAHNLKALALWEGMATSQPAVNSHLEQLGETLIRLTRWIGPHLKSSDLEAIYARCRPRIDARANLERDLELVVAAGGAACNHGNILKDSRRFTDALAAYDVARGHLAKALAVKPDHVKAKTFLITAVSGRGGSFNVLHRYADAVREWEAALALDDSQPRRTVWQIEHASSLARAREPKKALAALTAMDAAPAAFWFSRANAFAMVYTAAGADESTRLEAERQALNCLDHARQAGQLRDPKAVNRLTVAPEWAGLRERHSVDKLVNGIID